MQSKHGAQPDAIGCVRRESYTPLQIPPPRAHSWVDRGPPPPPGPPQKLLQTARVGTGGLMMPPASDRESPPRQQTDCWRGMRSSRGVTPLQHPWTTLCTESGQVPRRPAVPSQLPCSRAHGGAAPCPVGSSSWAASLRPTLAPHSPPAWSPETTSLLPI